MQPYVHIMHVCIYLAGICGGRGERSHWAKLPLYVSGKVAIIATK